MITVHLTEQLRKRGMTVTELANQVGITVANISILKNGRAKGLRFDTLERICQTLQCQPGDLLVWDGDDTPLQPRKQPAEAVAEPAEEPAKQTAKNVPWYLL